MDLLSLTQFIWRFWELTCETITAFSLLYLAVKYKRGK